MSYPFLLFREAVQRGDVDEAVKSILLTDPSLSDDVGGLTWPQNAVLIAYVHGSCHVAKEIGRRCPELTSMKTQHGHTIMHVVCAIGDFEMVKFLGRLNPQLCLIEDNYSEIPLHVAVVNGCGAEVIKELVDACPESLEKVTSRQETALHLALKNFQWDAFQILMYMAKELNQKHVFNMKDLEGNTILRIAASKKCIEIVKLLLQECSDNNMGHTALDVCAADPQDVVSKEIYKTLEKAPARDQELDSPRQQSIAKLPIDTRNVLLMVLGMIAASSFTVTCNLPAVFLKDIDLKGETVDAKDLIFGRVPTVFHLMVFNSSGFMTTISAIVLLIWPLLFRMILIFVVICTCIVYVILVNKITPKFSVRVGTSNISSIVLLWSLVITFVLCGVAILFIGKHGWSGFCRFINWLWKKGSNNLARFECITELGLIE